jgi:putative membrane protein insertion efficiency factor
MKALLIRMIRWYKKNISPSLGPHCRFDPSCSEYAAEAIEKYGAGKGMYLALRRVLRCHPFGGSGYDPVP